ncbi:MAG: hypothetical protein LKE41_09200 [Prevotella sp.]|nr:hypothetical protein [Prevotella sp.]MCI2081267.1 hypothetical protein [Prevotella sp.]MCI2103096.1 hypothetical protein [Prevotella sp.]
MAPIRSSISVRKVIFRISDGYTISDRSSQIVVSMAGNIFALYRELWIKYRLAE